MPNFPVYPLSQEQHVELSVNYCYALPKYNVVRYAEVTDYGGHAVLTFAGTLRQFVQTYRPLNIPVPAEAAVSMGLVTWEEVYENFDISDTVIAALRLAHPR